MRVHGAACNMVHTKGSFFVESDLWLGIPMLLRLHLHSTQGEREGGGGRGRERKNEEKYNIAPSTCTCESRRGHVYGPTISLFSGTWTHVTYQDLTPSPCGLPSTNSPPNTSPSTHEYSPSPCSCSCVWCVCWRYTLLRASHFSYTYIPTCVLTHMQKHTNTHTHTHTHTYIHTHTSPRGDGWVGGWGLRERKIRTWPSEKSPT